MFDEDMFDEDMLDEDMFGEDMLGEDMLDEDMFDEDILTTCLTRTCWMRTCLARTCYSKNRQLLHNFSSSIINPFLVIIGRSLPLSVDVVNIVDRTNPGEEARINVVFNRRRGDPVAEVGRT